MNSDDIVIYAACRTPVGRFLGSLSKTPAHKLGGAVITECLKRSTVPPEFISEVILGQCLTAGQGMNPARQASILAGLPPEVVATNINMACGSALKAMQLGYQAIYSGEARFVLAGGQENMSLAPHCQYLRTPVKYGDCVMKDTMWDDGLKDAFNNEMMGITGERVAGMYQISREAQDIFACGSHVKACSAINSDRFSKEICPVAMETSSGDRNVLFSIDELPRQDSKIENFSRLKPYFVTDAIGTVTAGNAAGINDGAACVIMGRYREVLSNNTTGADTSQTISTLPAPLARIVAFGQSGCDPKTMGLSPISAVKLAVSKAGWSIDSVDLWEINEAFAATTLACINQLGIDSNKVNVTGGSIAIGHPIGASGCRILVTLLHRMNECTAATCRGVATLCMGGGMGLAICVEKL